MKRRLFVSALVAGGIAAASGVASANPQYWRDNGLLLEVSADPRDGADTVRVDATRASELELVALNAPVTLRGMTLHFADGRSMTRQMNTVRPGQSLLVDLPANCAAITGVTLDYIDADMRRFDRTPARLQIIPRLTRSNVDHHVGYYDSNRYTYPSSSYYVQQPSRVSRYRVERPRRVQSTWQIQGSIRF